VFGAAGCSRTDQPPSPKDPSLVIKLRWIKSYPGQSRSQVATGLFWALSFLGAKLPADAAVISWDGTMVTLDLDAAGVSETSTAAWRRLVQVLKSSDEYRMMGGIDIGRFTFLSLCSSYQYYALTGVSPSYTQFRDRHTFAPKQVAIVESAVAHGNRLIEVGQGTDIDSVAFVAFEGTGALSDHSFQKADIETLDLMDNGQLRFGLYDLEGRLKATTTPALTAAGKPSKCLWCHEINLQPPFAEPTANRLAAEWNMPVERVEQLLAGRNLKTHPHSERIDDDVLGDNLYDRNDVDSLAPYATIRGPSDMREASNYEPNLLQ